MASTYQKGQTVTINTPRLVKRGFRQGSVVTIDYIYPAYVDGEPRQLYNVALASDPTLRNFFWHEELKEPPYNVAIPTQPLSPPPAANAAARPPA